MKSITKKIGSIALAASMAFGVAACGGGDDGKTTYYDNEENPLLLSTLEVDGVFNPFFSSSATDSSVVGMTQLGMLTSTEKGELDYGEDADTLVLDYQEVLEMGANGDKVDLDHDTRTTTFYFVLKNNVKFSNGSPVTMKDVLFNLYVYLDIAYTGSATIYSTDIVGLQEYRTQADSQTEQENYLKKYQTLANARIEGLLSAWESLGYDRYNSNKKPDNEYDEETLKEAFQELADGENASYKSIVEDYEAACRLFREELSNDFQAAIDTYSDIVFKDENGKEYKNLLTTNVEAFLYNEGKIQWNKKDGKLTSSYTTDSEIASLKEWANGKDADGKPDGGKTKATERVYLENIPDKLGEVIQYWGTANTLFEELTNDEIEKASESAEGRKYKNISGIKFANGGEERGGEDSVIVNGKKYDKPTYNEDGSVASGNEVLSIKIKGVDPKAKWNFAFTVAPMYYYSTPELAKAFDYVENFGVKWSNQTFMNTVVKDPAKIGVPVGAGPYMASKESGGTSNVAAGDFRRNGIIYYERNPYYLHEVKIKKVRYVVVASSQMTTDLYSGRVDYSEPNAKPETIQEIGKRKDVDSMRAETNGYGYIGINASKIPHINVRRAIMYSINPKLCVDYYKNEAKELYRSMSRASEYYPEDATAYYPYIGGEVPERLDVVDPAYAAFVALKGKKAGQKFSEKEQIEFITTLLEDPISLDASYTPKSRYSFKMDRNSGVYANGDHRCRYIFTIAGEVTDHPAWQALYDASTLLNKCGFDITVSTDSQALQKLASGSLTVWAAAWSSTIDPDMYQVYHKDSKASSVQNWGYPAILRNAGDRYSIENEILTLLSRYIEQGRQVTLPAERKKYYTPALTEVMKLAVEMPTYQRNDLFAYNPKKIDSTTLFDPTSYKGPISDIYNVSLIVKNEIA